MIQSMRKTGLGILAVILPGGGVAYVRAAGALEKFKIYKDGEGDADEQIGVNIVKRALEEPLRLIAQNAGREGAVIVERVRAEKNENVGFKERGVNRGLDAYTTEAMISELPELGKAQALPGGAMGF